MSEKRNHPDEQPEKPKGGGFLARMAAAAKGKIVAAMKGKNEGNPEVQTHIDGISEHLELLGTARKEQNWPECKKIIGTVRVLFESTPKENLRGFQGAQYQKLQRDYEKAKALTGLELHMSDIQKKNMTSASGRLEIVGALAKLHQLLTLCRSLGIETTHHATVLDELESGLRQSMEQQRGKELSDDITTSMETLESVAQGHIPSSEQSDPTQLLAAVALNLQDSKAARIETVEQYRQLFGDRENPESSLVIRALARSVMSSVRRLPDVSNAELRQGGNMNEAGMELERHDVTRALLTALEHHNITTVPGTETKINQLKGELFKKRHKLPTSPKMIQVDVGGKQRSRLETPAEVMKGEMDFVLNGLILRLATILRNTGTVLTEEQQTKMEEAIAEMYATNFVTIEDARAAGVSEESFARWNSRAHLLSAKAKGMDSTMKTKQAFEQALDAFRDAVLQAGSPVNIADALGDFESTLKWQPVYRALRLVDPQYGATKVDQLLKDSLPLELAYVRGHGIEAQTQTSLCFACSLEAAKTIGIPLTREHGLSQEYFARAENIEATKAGATIYKQESLRRQEQALRHFGMAFMQYEKMCEELGDTGREKIETSLRTIRESVASDSTRLAQGIQEKNADVQREVMEKIAPGMQEFWGQIFEYVQVKLDLLEEIVIKATSNADPNLQSAKKEAAEAIDFAEFGASIHPEYIQKLRQRFFALTFQDQVQALPRVTEKMEE